MKWEHQRTRIETARSFLFVPGDRPDRFAKACDSGTDIVVIDLEDAVAPTQKQAARSFALSWLSSGHEAMIRINEAGSEWFEDDLALSAEPGLLGIMLPKAVQGAALTRVADLVPTVALIETARALLKLEPILKTEGIARLAFGTIDLALDLDVSDPQVITNVGVQLVMASRACGAPAPIDGVTIDFRDPTAVENAVRAAKARGFHGKLCIHPMQVVPTHAGLLPTAEEVARARRIVEADKASSGAAVALNGAMLDRPIVSRAYRILAEAQPDHLIEGQPISHPT